MKTLLTTTILCLSSILTLAQNFEIGALFGGSNYTGDLAANTITLKETKPAAALWIQPHFSRRLSARIGVAYGMISGNDANSDAAGTRLRNLSFRTQLVEGSLQLVLTPFGNDRRLQPYVFGGIGVFRFNPKAQLNGEWIALQPLGTEGQDLLLNGTQPYPLTQTMFPFGIGIKLLSYSGWAWGLEAGYRKTFTDYLDDVSTTYPDKQALLEQNGATAVALSDRSGEVNNGENVFQEGAVRGNPEFDDGYLFVGITLSYRIVRHKEKYGCPTF